MKIFEKKHATGDEKKRYADLITSDRPNGRRVALSFAEVESLTVQSDMPMTSIRTLLKRGAIAENPDQMIYGDFTDVVDYETSLQRIDRAQQSFAALPAKIRDRFHNDPAELIEFVSNADNRDEAIKLGLIAEIPTHPASSVPASDRDNHEPKTTKKTAPNSKQDAENP